MKSDSGDARGNLLLRPWWNWLALVLLAVASVAYAWQTMVRANGAFFYADDYAFIQSSASWAEQVFAPYNGHVGYTAGLLWVTLLELVGPASYVPFLGLAVVLVVISAAAVFFMVRRLLGPIAALAAALWVLFLGPAFHNQLWDQASLALVVLPVLVALAFMVERPGSRWVGLSVAVVLIGAGTGGLSAGVLAAFIVMCLVLRRWVLAAGMAVVLLAFTAIGASSLPAETNAGASPLVLFSRIPSYVLTALQGTVQVGLNVPTGMAGAIALGVLVILAWGLVLAFRQPKTLAGSALLLSSSYLLFTWAAAGYVRGIVDEVAAPRYIGVTGPVLLIAVAAATKLLAEAYPRVTGEALVGTVAASILLIAALSNLPSWRDARQNASFLGEGNLAALSAMHAGRGWIAPGFAPPGDGLMYVRQGPLEDAWARRGMPNLEPGAIRNRSFPSQAAERFLQTSLAAGWIQQQPVVPRRYQRPTTCISQVVIASGRATAIRVFGSGPVTASVLGAPPQPVPYSGADGRLLVRPLAGAGDLVLQRPNGCLAPLAG